MCTLWSPVLPSTVYQTATDQHNYTLEPTGRFWSLLLYTMWHLSWFFQLLCIDSLQSSIHSLTLPQTDQWQQLDLTGADGPTLRTSSQVHAHLRMLRMSFHSLVSSGMRLRLMSAMSRSWSLPPLSGFDFSYKLCRSGLIQAYRFEPDVDSYALLMHWRKGTGILGNDNLLWSRPTFQCVKCWMWTRKSTKYCWSHPLHCSAYSLEESATGTESPTDGLCLGLHDEACNLHSNRRCHCHRRHC